MSAEAMGWVFRHSPFRGATYAVHLAMADSANDQNDYLVWLSNSKTATKARCEIRSVVDAKAKLVAGGFAELIDSQHGNAGAATYRMLFPDVPVVYDSTERRRTRANPAPVQSTTSANDDTHQCNPRHPLVQSTVSSPITNPSEPKEPKGRSQRSRRGLVPANFAVTPEMRQWATVRGIHSDPMTETEKFVNHHRSKGTVFADPVAAWRKWMLNADEFSRPGIAQGNRSRSLLAVDSVLGTVSTHQEALPS